MFYSEGEITDLKKTLVVELKYCICNFTDKSEALR